MRGNQSVYDTARLCRKANIKREIYSSFWITGMACDGVYTVQWPQKYLDAYATLNAFAVDTMIS